jgi:predicted heme/steroid binding protein
LNGNKAYIAVDGIVYDVTAVAQWGARLHAGKFQAGKDYTEELKSAPHGVEKLLTAARIGVLAE